MKKIHFLFLALLSLSIISCNNDSEVVPEPLSEDQKDIVIDEALQSAVLDDILQDIDTYSFLGEGLKSAETGGCPAVTIQRPGSAPFWPRTITLDFGDGCDKNGKIKLGKMIIEKSGPWFEAGSIRKVTFENFVVDGMSIDGEKEIENITPVGGNPTFAIDAEMDLAWTKNDTLDITVHREMDKTQEWILGFRNKDVRGQIILNGETEITRTVNGVEKSIEKTYNDISVVFGCRFPQMGVTEFKVTTFDGIELEFTLDYGTEGAAGEKCRENCDCIATLSVEDQTTEDIDLSERWRKWTKEKKKGKDD